MYFIQSQPEFAVQITESRFVLRPAQIEIHTTVQSPLNHGPTWTRARFTTDLKWPKAIRIYRIHSIFFHSRRIQISTICSKSLRFCSDSAALVFQLKNNASKIKSWTNVASVDSAVKRRRRKTPVWSGIFSEFVAMFISEFASRFVN